MTEEKSVDPIVARTTKFGSFFGCIKVTRWAKVNGQLWSHVPFYLPDFWTRTRSGSSKADLMVSFVERLQRACPLDLGFTKLLSATQNLLTFQDYSYNAKVFTPFKLCFEECQLYHNSHTHDNGAPLGRKLIATDIWRALFQKELSIIKWVVLLGTQDKTGALYRWSRHELFERHLVDEILEYIRDRGTTSGAVEMTY